MIAKVEIRTTHDPKSGTFGVVYVDGKLILTIYKGRIENHIGAETTFSEETIREMDRKIKEWIRDNLGRK